MTCASDVTVITEVALWTTDGAQVAGSPPVDRKVPGSRTHLGLVTVR